MSILQAFNEASLARHLVKEDFYKNTSLSDDNYRYTLISTALHQAENLFPNGINYHYFFKNDKKSFSIDNLSQKIILRKCATHLKSSSQKKNKSRSQIAREIKIFLLDGTPCKVYRLDIKSFFENIDKDQLLVVINNTKSLSMHTKKLILTSIDFFYRSEKVAVPRGVETSPLLADIFMQDFDKSVISRNDVFFYSRFVDDILVITSNETEEKIFEHELKTKLPKGLFFNNNKRNFIKIEKRKKAGSIHHGKVVGSFDYLGFEFNVVDTPLPTKNENGNTVENANAAAGAFREVIIDISQRKTKRIKEKLCKAFYSYHKNGDFPLLKDRVMFLTTNRELVKKDKSIVVPVGIYYNNSASGFSSKALKHLDDFMRHLLFNNTGRLSRLYTSKLKISQKKELAKFGFCYGFENRVHRRFSPNRLAEIVKAWK